jgi:hypothetical protein
MLLVVWCPPPPAGISGFAKTVLAAFFVLLLNVQNAQAQWLCSTSAYITGFSGVPCYGQKEYYSHSFGSLSCGSPKVFRWRVDGALSIEFTNTPIVGLPTTERIVGIGGGYREFYVYGDNQVIRVEWAGNSDGYYVDGESEDNCGFWGLCGIGGARLTLQTRSPLPTTITPNTTSVTCGVPTYVTLASNVSGIGLNYEWPQSFGNGSFVFNSSTDNAATYYYNGNNAGSSAGISVFVADNCGQNRRFIPTPSISIVAPTPAIYGASLLCSNMEVYESYTATPANGTVSWTLSGSGWVGEQQGNDYLIIQTGSRSATLQATIQSNCFSTPRVVTKFIGVTSSMACYQRVIPGEEPKVSEDEATSFVIYPNPSSQVFSLTVPKGTTVEEIKILDNMGTVVKNFDKAEKANLQASIENLKEGLYTVVIKTTDTVIAKKLQIKK